MYNINMQLGNNLTNLKPVDIQAKKQGKIANCIKL